MTKGIFVRNMDKLKVVINRTDTCYISKNQNCFVSWKIFKNAYSNFDGVFFSEGTILQLVFEFFHIWTILQQVFEFFHVWEVSSF